jgi:hypothetical protein
LSVAIASGNSVLGAKQKPATKLFFCLTS